MKPKLPASFALARRRLRSDSFVLYLGVMSELFRCHEDKGFVRELSGYFRSRRFDLALTFSDSLSKQSYLDATTHFVANQFAQLVRKYPWDPKVVKTDPESKAIGSFLLSERRCRRLNRKFGLYGTLRSPREEQFSKMRSFIRHVLGEEPPIETILSGCAFGNGASVGVHGNATNLARKLLADPWTVSPGAFTYSYWALMKEPRLRDLLLENSSLISCLDWLTAKTRFASKTLLVNYNKISFVPKTALVHRAIAVEPLLNGFLQGGIDTFMRNCLKRVGIDLRDQSLNQRMARSGSFDGSELSYCTIDLSSASDSISIGLVRQLLPPMWFDFLNSTRSHRYMLGKDITVYAKFCSMGNGFCFPLESLIFAACCHATDCGTPGKDFSVYGDDIVVRATHAKEVLSLLKVMGFLPNASKTFLKGPFRESCGSDWFGGVDVRPYTLDYALDSLESLFKWLNLTRRSEITSRFFESTWDIILSQVPVDFRFFRPYKGNADSGIDSWADQHLTSPTCSWNIREQIWVCKELSHRPVLDSGLPVSAYRRDSVDMYALLSGVASHHYQVGYTLRRKTKTTASSVRSSSATSTWLPPIRYDAECRMQMRQPKRVSNPSVAVLSLKRRLEDILP